MASEENVLNLLGAMSAPQVFSAEQCAEIIELGTSQWRESVAQVADGAGVGNVDTSYRSTTLYTPPAHEQWISQQLIKTITAINRQAWRFEITEMRERPALMKYESGAAGFYDWHVDIGVQKVMASRKLSYSLLLNPGEYAGGELQFLRGKEPITAENLDQPGNMIIFPSYMMHRVARVETGTRYALVGWIHGPTFR